MPSERDLIRVIVEIIVELREGEDDAENADDPQALVGFFCLLMLLRKKTDLSLLSVRRQPIGHLAGHLSQRQIFTQDQRTTRNDP